MAEILTENGTRSRLQPARKVQLEPFARAAAVTDCAVYWLPVPKFPMLPAQREWLEVLHRRLAALLHKQNGLREELFFQFKMLYPDLIDRFTSTSSAYMPITGMSLRPGNVPVNPPDLDAVRKQVESAQKNSTAVDTTQWMPDYLYWFARKRADEQRSHFLGFGGMLTLYLAPDPQTSAPAVEMPGFVKSLPVYDAKMHDDIQAAYSLRDAFLDRSKSAFGERFREDPAYNGMAFILPLLSSEALLSATQQERSHWFSVFDGYFAESKQDHGMILALKDPDFDESLSQLLSQMREDGLVYRA